MRRTEPCEHPNCDCGNYAPASPQPESTPRDFETPLSAGIKRAVEEYAKDYEARFAEIAKEQGAIYTCGWR